MKKTLNVQVPADILDWERCVIQGRDHWMGQVPALAFEAYTDELPRRLALVEAAGFDGAIVEPIRGWQ